MEILYVLLAFGAMALGVGIGLYILGFLAFIIYFLAGLGWNSAQKIFERWDIT